MVLHRTFGRFHAWLEGWPNSALTVVLLLAAVSLVFLALFGRPWMKAIAAAYVLFP